MADTVATKTIFSASNKKILSLTNVSDGTGETDVAKVTLSALSGVPSKVHIDFVSYSIGGGSVKLGFDHTSEDTALVLSGNGHMDFSRSGGFYDPGSAGGTGNILVSTIGMVANDTYTIILEIGW